MQAWGCRCSPAMRGPDEQGHPVWGALAHSTPAAWGGAAAQLQIPQTIFREAMMADEAQVQRLTPSMYLKMCDCPGWGMPGFRHIFVLQCSCRQSDTSARYAGRQTEQPSAASVADLMYIVAAGSTAALCDAFAAYSEACVDHQIPFVTDRAMNLATATAIKTPSARQQEERYPGCHSCADKGGAARHSSLLPTA